VSMFHRGTHNLSVSCLSGCETFVKAAGYLFVTLSTTTKQTNKMEESILQCILASANTVIKGWRIAFPLSVCSMEPVYLSLVMHGIKYILITCLTV